MKSFSTKGQPESVGFRYEFPQQEGFESVQIVEELTEFALPRGSTAWWIPGRRYNRYEYLYQSGGLDDIETAHTPFTLRTPNGTHLSIHEAALVDYAAFVLDQRHSGGRDGACPRGIQHVHLSLQLQNVAGPGSRRTE